MGKFIYRYESIKNVKEILKKKVQKEVSAIDLEIEKCEDDIQKTLKIIAETTLNLNSFKISASNFNFYKNYIKELQDKIDTIKIEIEDLQKKREEKVQELISKSKEEKIFSALKDIHKEQFNEEEKKLEMLTLDEIAMQKYTRENK